MIDIAKDDEQRIAIVDEILKKYSLVHSVISHDAWMAIMDALAVEEKRWQTEMYTPEKLEFKAGVLFGLKIVRDYADRVKKELNFLTNQKQELINSQLKG